MVRGALDSKRDTDEHGESVALVTNRRLFGADSWRWVHVPAHRALYYEVLNGRSADFARDHGDDFRDIARLGCDLGPLGGLCQRSHAIELGASSQLVALEYCAGCGHVYHGVLTTGRPTRHGFGDLDGDWRHWVLFCDDPVYGAAFVTGPRAYERLPRAEPALRLSTCRLHCGVDYCLDQHAAFD